MVERNSKAADDPAAASAKNAVDRASSKTPLSDDGDIDPAHVRETVKHKQQDEHAEPDNPQAGPGPVEASPNHVREKGHQDTAPTPERLRHETEDLPRETAKAEARDETPPRL